MKILCKPAIFCSFLFMYAFAYDINIPVHYDSLDNGLKVLIVPDANVAVASCRLYYFVGSMYESHGTTGLSHMFEHMMFKGTKRLGTTDYAKEKPWLDKIDSVDSIIGSLQNKGVTEKDSIYQALRGKINEYMAQERKYIKKDEIWRLYSDNGGTNLNAWTADDMTAYLVTLPRNKLELFYWIESDRMQNAVLREFYSERDVVTEERRMRIDNQPYGRFSEHFNALFYLAHPFRIPTIGWISDIRAYTIHKLYNHIHHFYTPDNALIVLSGNVDPAGAMAGIRRYFGAIPRAAAPKTEVVTREPKPLGEVRYTVHDNAEPRIEIMYHTPGYPNDDLYKLEVIEGVLSGRSGRLYQRLVNQDRLCTDAGASNEIRIQEGYIDVWADLKEDADPAKVEKVLLEEIDKLANEKPSATEMERIKNDIRMSFASSLKSLEGISDRLAWYQRLGDWRAMMEYPDKIAQVKAGDIPAIVRRYLDPEYKTIGLLLPPVTPPSGTQPATPEKKGR